MFLTVFRITVGLITRGPTTAALGYAAPNAVGPDDVGPACVTPDGTTPDDGVPPYGVSPYGPPGGASPYGPPSGGASPYGPPRRGISPYGGPNNSGAPYGAPEQLRCSLRRRPTIRCRRMAPVQSPAVQSHPKQRRRAVSSAAARRLGAGGLCRSVARLCGGHRGTDGFADPGLISGLSLTARSLECARSRSGVLAVLVSIRLTNIGDCRRYAGSRDVDPDARAFARVHARVASTRGPIGSRFGVRVRRTGLPCFDKPSPGRTQRRRGFRRRPMRLRQSAAGHRDR